MNTRWIGIILFILVAMTFARFVPGGCERRAPELAELRVLDAGDDRVVRIKGRLLMGHRQGYYYQVEDGGEPVDEPAFFGTLPPGTPLLNFTVHTAGDGELLAVASETYPNEILILHDFATDESWPAHDGSQQVEAFQARGRSLFKRFTDAYDGPAAGFTLRPAEYMRPLPPPPDRMVDGRSPTPTD